MIKNIILDVGGILFDDSKENLVKLLNKNCDLLYKETYGKGFKECLLGNQTIKEYLNTLKDKDNYQEIEYVLNKQNLYRTYPIMSDNFNYIKKLRQKGYKIYLLTNITKDSYYYINDTINIDSTFDGGVYYYQEHLIKPDAKIYTLLFEKYNLPKEETIFFDDKEKNIIAAQALGIKAILFTSITDIEGALK